MGNDAIANEAPLIKQYDNINNYFSQSNENTPFNKKRSNFKSMNFEGNYSPSKSQAGQRISDIVS